jgi:hypothetical protein
MTMAPISSSSVGGCTAGVAAAGAALLGQCEAFVTLVATADGRYSAPSTVLPGGTIGKHVRHSLDHFRAALEGHETATVIDYDQRVRNVPMETSPEHALMAIGELRQRLRQLDELSLNQPVRVRVMLSGSGDEAELTSTLARELAFATHHAIHHHAMMGAIAAEFGIHAGPEFGKAPSTINHERCQG